jgi:hypothetical protein
MNNITQNTTKEAPISSASLDAAATSTTSVGDIDRHVGKLNIALQHRKKVTPFISDPQRQELVNRYREILENSGTPTSNDHLRTICNNSIYLAATGNLEDFCLTFLRIDKTVAAGLLAERPTQVAGEASSASVSQEEAHPDRLASTPQTSFSTASTFTTAPFSTKALMKVDTEVPHQAVAVPERSMKTARKDRGKTDREAEGSKPESIVTPGSRPCR